MNKSERKTRTLNAIYATVPHNSLSSQPGTWVHSPDMYKGTKPMVFHMDLGSVKQHVTAVPPSQPNYPPLTRSVSLRHTFFLHYRWRDRIKISRKVDLCVECNCACKAKIVMFINGHERRVNKIAAC